jgi:hypothetical protein
MVKRVGRNDPCTCGSGRKYKKCHGLQADDSGSQQALLKLLPMNHHANGTLTRNFLGLRLNDEVQ